MDDVTIQKKREFIIRCTADGGLDIADGDGRKGGNLKTRPARKITWTNATQQPKCFLAFTYMVLDEVVDVGPRIWPFTGPVPGDGLLELQQGVPTERTLLDFKTATYVEYAVLGADSQPLLDPVIIIEPN